MAVSHGCVYIMMYCMYYSHPPPIIYCSLIGLMFTAMMSTELEATGHMQTEFKRSKGLSVTQE